MRRFVLAHVLAGCCLGAETPVSPTNELWLFLNVKDGKAETSQGGSQWEIPAVNDVRPPLSIVVHNPDKSSDRMCCDLEWNALDPKTATCGTFIASPSSFKGVITAEATLKTDVDVSGTGVDITASPFREVEVKGATSSKTCNDLYATKISDEISTAVESGLSFVFSSDASGGGKAIAAKKGDINDPQQQKALIVYSTATAHPVCCNLIWIYGGVDGSSVDTASCSSFEVLVKEDSATVTGNVNIFSSKGTFVSIGIKSFTIDGTPVSKVASAHLHSKRCSEESGGPHYLHGPIVAASTASTASSTTVATLETTAATTAATTTSTAAPIPTNKCGDGKREGDERCDDGNVLSHDGCSKDCTVEEGYSCEKGPDNHDNCAKLCGNGKKSNEEQCDDGNVVHGDGCSIQCTVEEGYSCRGGSITSKDTCSKICGNGKRDDGEECDDGNEVSGDGCSSKCKTESDYSCRGGTASTKDVCTKNCGNGVIDHAASEQCDDKQEIPKDNDGCSSDCMTEIGWECSGEPSVCHLIKNPSTTTSSVGVSEVGLFVIIVGAVASAYMYHQRKKLKTNASNGTTPNTKEDGSHFERVPLTANIGAGGGASSWGNVVDDEEAWDAWEEKNDIQLEMPTISVNKSSSRIDLVPSISSVMDIAPVADRGRISPAPMVSGWDTELGDSSAWDEPLSLPASSPASPPTYNVDIAPFSTGKSSPPLSNFDASLPPITSFGSSTARAAKPAEIKPVKPLKSPPSDDIFSSFGMVPDFKPAVKIAKN